MKMPGAFPYYRANLPGILGIPSHEYRVEGEYALIWGGR